MLKGIMTRLGYEKRADSSYTDALVAVLTSGAAGTSQALPTATAASGIMRRFGRPRICRLRGTRA